MAESKKTKEAPRLRPKQSAGPVPRLRPDEWDREAARALRESDHPMNPPRMVAPVDEPGDIVDFGQGTGYQEPQGVFNELGQMIEGFLRGGAGEGGMAPAAPQQPVAVGDYQLREGDPTVVGMTTQQQVALSQMLEKIPSLTPEQRAAERARISAMRLPEGMKSRLLEALGAP